MPKLRTNIYLAKEQKKLLEKLSNRTGAPVAELVRRAIDSYLLVRKKELKPSLQDALAEHGCGGKRNRG